MSYEKRNEKRIIGPLRWQRSNLRKCYGYSSEDPTVQKISRDVPRFLMDDSKIQGFKVPFTRIQIF